MKKSEKEPTLAARLAEAERTIAAARDSEGPFALADQAAETALHDLQAALDAVLEHRTVAASDVDVLRVLDAWLGDMATDQVVPTLLAFAGSVRTSWPAAWDHVRGPLARTRIAMAARVWAPRTAANPAALAATWLDDYARQLAGLMLNDPVLGEAARIRAGQLPALRAQLAEIAQQHLESARVELERVDQAQADAAAATARAEAERRRRVIDYAGARPQHLFIIGNQPYDGRQIVAIVSRTACYDRDSGEFIPADARPSMQVIEDALRAAGAVL